MPSSATTWPIRKTIDTGDVEAAFAKADLVVEDTLRLRPPHRRQPRSRAPCSPPTTRARASSPSTTSSQCPHMIQRVFAHTLGIPDHNVQIVAPDVGGLFGLKIHTYGDEVATTAAAIELGRPVKFIADRLGVVRLRHPRPRELRQGAHGREQGGRDSGLRHRRAVRRRRLFAVSAHQRVRGQRRSSTSPAGPIATGTIEARATVVYLNKPPSSQYRAVGHPIGNAVGEHLVDRAAAALGIDPIEIRRRNVMPDDAYPAVTASGIKLKDLSHQRCLDVLVERMRYASCARSRRRLRETGHPPRHRHRLLHQGHLARARRATTAPAARRSRCRTPASSSSSPTAASSARSASPSRARAPTPSWARSPPPRSGVPMASVRVISGDTDAVPYGGGTFGSRAVAIGGEAVYQAARDLQAGDPRHCRRAAAGRRLRRSTSPTAWSSIAPAAPSASRSPRSAASATSSSANCRAACSPSSRTRAASAWSATSTSSPTASTAPMSRSTPTPASCAS